MRFKWDRNKFQSNLVKHSVAFTEAALIFEDNSLLSFFDEKHSENEERWLSIGLTTTGKLLVVAHTFGIFEGEELVRIISARKPTKAETEIYYARRI